MRLGVEIVGTGTRDYKLYDVQMQIQVLQCPQIGIPVTLHVMRHPSCRVPFCLVIGNQISTAN